MNTSLALLCIIYDYYMKLADTEKCIYVQKKKDSR